MRPTRPARIFLIAGSLAAAAVVAAGAPARDRTEEILRITHGPKPEYPERAKAEGLGAGEAHVLVEVDEFGQPDDLMLVAYTHEVFGDALLKAVREWRFTPARRDGKPMRTILRVELGFRIGTEGMVFVDRKGPASFSRDGPRAGSRFEFEPCGAGDLDRGLRPVSRVAPAYPKALKEGGTGGRLRVDFYIDAEGRARFPRVAEPVHPVLDAASIAAVKEWRFDPPRRRGRPALVHASQVFDFVPDKS